MIVEGIFIVRHAPVTYNDPAHERLRGQSDPPIAPEGRTIAMERAQFFKDLPIVRIYHDGLQRSRIMAQAIAKVTGGAVIEDKRVGAWNMGELQGQLVTTAERKLDAYLFRTPSVPIPGGESYSEFARRWIGFLQAHRRDRGTVAVTHLRNIMTAAAWAKAGASGWRLKLARNYQPLKKIEIAWLSNGEFIVVQRKPKEEQMVSK